MADTKNDTNIQEKPRRNSPLNKGGKQEEGNDEDWMATYADVVTLLMCFFVMMLSLMEPKDSDVQKVQKMFSAAFSDVESEDPQEQSMVQAAQEMLESTAMDQVMAVEETDNGIAIDIASGAMFASGSAKFTPEGAKILDEVSHLLFRYDMEDYTIEIEGHTDDAPISTALYPSNWELSAGRSASVVRYLIELGHDKNQMRVIGLADVEGKVPNLDEFGNPIAENRELNRRVVIRVERRRD